MHKQRPSCMAPGTRRDLQSNHGCLVTSAYCRAVHARGVLLVQLDVPRAPRRSGNAAARLLATRNTTYAQHSTQHGYRDRGQQRCTLRSKPAHCGTGARTSNMAACMLADRSRWHRKPNYGFSYSYYLPCSPPPLHARAHRHTHR
jgi:hypothetical protein